MGFHKVIQQLEITGKKKNGKGGGVATFVQRGVRYNLINIMIRKMSGIRKNYTIPVLISYNKTAINNIEKAEHLAEMKTCSSENLSDVTKQSRDNTLAQNNVRKATTSESLDY